ncbi:MAG: phosphonatase-like hydrolase [Leucobacter sp.]
MSFRMVSLDMAGTTFDDGNTVYEVLSDSVSQAAETEVPQSLLDQWTGTSKLEAIEGMLGALERSADAQQVYAQFTDALNTRYRENPPKPFAGVTEMFAELRDAGVKVALQTGYSTPVTEVLLESAGWRVGTHLDAVVSSDEVAASRPAPYLIFHTMEATGVVDVREVLVAGDTPNDLLAGTRAGARYVVGVLSGAHDADELGRTPHTHLLAGVTEITSLR